jgi:3-phenylpropionate/cinnamic acid dioxygenase small subunit
MSTPAPQGDSARGRGHEVRAQVCDELRASEGVGASDAFRCEGREALRVWITRWRTAASAAQPAARATFVRHHLATADIEITGESSANARTYWVVYTDAGPDHCGHYIDVFRKVGESWLIAHRKVRLDWRSPHSLFATAIEGVR